MQLSVAAAYDRSAPEDLGIAEARARARKPPWQSTSAKFCATSATDRPHFDFSPPKPGWSFRGRRLAARSQHAQLPKANALLTALAYPQPAFRGNYTIVGIALQAARALYTPGGTQQHGRVCAPPGRLRRAALHCPQCPQARRWRTGNQHSPPGECIRRLHLARHATKRPTGTGTASFQCAQSAHLTKRSCRRMKASAGG